ncbi:MAG: hypothetical protein ACM3H7_02610 [Acidobacteriaceae bacterium]
MDASFWLKLILSFIVGSLWVSITTLSAERLGSRIGGLIGGLPSTVVIALLFIGLTQSPHVAAQSTTVMPIAQGLNGLFVLTFMLFIPYGLWIGSLSALMVWIFQATFLYLLDIRAFWISLAGWVILLLACIVVLEKWMKVPSLPKLRVNYPSQQLIWRAFFGGGVISLAVLMGKLGGPLVGGIFGSFPAMFLSTLVITYKTGGTGFSRSVGKSLLLSGLINVPVYEIVVRVTFPLLGLAAGTVIGLAIALCSGCATYQGMKAWMK